MKKVSIIAAVVIVVAVVAYVWVSKKSETGKKEVETEKVDPNAFRQDQIEAIVMAELDSIANIWASRPAVVNAFKDGEFKFSEQELKVKPDYLLSPDVVNNLNLMSQKYRAIGMLAIDMTVADNYKMDTEAYKAAIKKLVIDVNDPAIKLGVDVDEEYIRNVFNKEKENNRINYFWEVCAAINVENLYVVSKNIDKLLTAFDDKAAENFTWHIVMLTIALENLAEYDADIRALVANLAPLKSLDAINVAQFKEQLESIAPQVEAIRNSLLK
ncbi:MAG: hypothetical protein HUJ89_00795 [Bacteroidales bacterium]|nr:hypothetical protein [Bacteroidales bacterium]